MSLVWNKYQVPCPELSLVYGISTSSLPISICLGLLEICASYVLLCKSSVDFIGETFKNISDSCNQYYHDSKDYIKYFMDVAVGLISIKDPRAALTQLEAILNQQDSLIFLNQASKIIIGSVMIEKLKQANENFDEGIFLSDNELVDYATNILQVVSNRFLVCIQIYEQNESNQQIEKSMSKPAKGGAYPVIHLFKCQMKYYLACAKELYELKTNQNSTNNIFVDMPFIHGAAKNHCPVGPPKQIQIPQIDFTNESQVFKHLIDSMAKELRARGGFSEELKSLINNCSQNNQTIRTIPSLFETPQYCRNCNAKLLKNNYSNTSHINCGFCDLCLIRLKSSCIICGLSLTQNDKTLLGL